MARKIFHDFVNPAADQAGFIGTKPSNWNAALEISNAGLSAPSGTDALVREILTADRNYYIRTDGNDSNDGLTNSAGGAKATLASAWADAVKLDCNDFNVIFNYGTGTFTAATMLSVPMANCSGPDIVGVDASGSTLLTTASSYVGGSVATIGVTGPGVYFNLRNVKIRNAFAGVVDNTCCLSAAAFASIYVDTGVIFDSVASAGSGVSHVIAYKNGTIYLDEDYTISGQAPTHIFGQGGYFENFATTVTMSGTQNYSGGFLVLDIGSVYYGACTFTGGTITGQRYNIQNGSVARTFAGYTAQYFPGSVAGAVDSTSSLEGASLREVLTGNRVYYVRSDGNDSNDGFNNSASGAFLTIQKAMDTITSKLDLAGFDVTIQWASASTYTAASYGIICSGWVGGGRVFLDMNSQTLSCTNSCIAFVGPSQGVFYISNVTFASTNICAIHITAAQAVHTLAGVNYGACPSAQHILCSAPGAVFAADSNYTISGNANNHIRVLSPGSQAGINGLTITISGTPTITGPFVEAFPGFIDAQSVTFSGSIAAGSTQYNVNGGGYIRKPSTTFPGSLAGTGGTTTGGGYIT